MWYLGQDKKEEAVTGPAATFSSYARALELGEAIPRSILELVGDDPTPYQVLTRLVPRAERRVRGTYFSSAALAADLWSDALQSITPGSIIVDPACGAGDLLTPAIEHVSATSLGGVVFRACDIDEDLTRVATARLRQVLGTTSSLVEGICADLMADTSSITSATHVVLNPPFVPIAAAEPWASGQINSAALFTVRALESMSHGARLLAVLPDVLRSGSRYQTWRDTVKRLGGINSIRTLDVFDNHADVHVFTIDITAGQTQHAASWPGGAQTGPTLADFADIRVGPVVPHRDPETGPLCAYITARSLTSGETLERRFAGRKERGPFVLVNRTSRPGERRARTHLWSSADEAAVENHLLIVAPKAGVTCADVIAVLHSASTSEFLDERIRCRHLTVRALGEIPWPN